MDPEVLETARANAVAAAMGNVSFEHHVLPDVELAELVDALVGRLILVHLAGACHSGGAPGDDLPRVDLRGTARSRQQPRHGRTTGSGTAIRGAGPSRGRRRRPDGWRGLAGDVPHRGNRAQSPAAARPPVDPETATALESALARAVVDLYGTDPLASGEYGRIVNERYFDRLTGLLDSGRVVIGGANDRTAKCFARTVLADVDPKSPVMQEEIFGPSLPIVTVSDLDAAIDFIDDCDKPLALYTFTDSGDTRARIAAEISSGGLGHGRCSIETFSHRKAVLEKPLG